MNKVILIGRITKDPELRQTPSGVPVVQFTLAVNRNYQNKSGERQADFITCVVWRNQAENLAKYIRKGGLLAVEGNIQTNSYDDPSGVRRYTTNVVCDQITFLEAKKNGNNDFNFNQLPEEPSYSGSYNQNNYNNQASKQSNNPFEDIDNSFDVSDDDFPF